jgi:hypothetical protein
MEENEMNRKAKFCCVLLVVIMLMTLLAACGGNGADSTSPPTRTNPPAGNNPAQGGNTPAPIVDPPPFVRPAHDRTVKILGGATPMSSLDDEVGQMIYADLGIIIEFVPFAGSADENSRLMLASRNFGDIDMMILGLDTTVQQYIEADALVNLDNYRHMLTRFYERSKDIIPFWRMLDARNGDLFVWQPGPDESQMTQPPLDIVTRVDVLEALGWPNLDTTDDYLAFLQAGLEMFPTTNGFPTVGMGFNWGTATGTLQATYMVRHSGFSHIYKLTAMIDVENDKMLPLMSHPYTKETLRFWNSMQRYGFMDREAWTDTGPMLEAKMNQGIPITANFFNWRIRQTNAVLTESGNPEMHYIVTPIRLQLAKDEGRNVRYEIYNITRAGDTSGILATSRNIEACVDLIEWFSRAEASIFVGWGQEGRDYTVDANGFRIPTQAFIDGVNSPESITFLNERGMTQYTHRFPIRFFARQANGQPYRYQTDPGFLLMSASATQAKAYAALGWESAVCGWTNNPNFEYIPFNVTNFVAAANLDPESPEGQAEMRIIDYLNSQIPIIVNARSEAAFEAAYNEAVTRVTALGNDSVVAKYNEQYQAIGSRLAELRLR